MKVVVTSNLPAVIYDTLDGFIVEANSSDEPLSSIRLRQMGSTADGMITTTNDIIDRALIEACPRLKVIANCDITTDNIDVDYAAHRGITVCSTKHILTQCTAELGFALMMSAARRIPEADRYTKIGTLTGAANHNMILGLDFHKKTLGIYGMGHIGQAVAKIASGFSMDIIYHNRKRDKQSELIVGATYATMDELLEWSDFLIITAPCTVETKYAFTINEIRKMKRNAVLVNIGGGGIIKEDDLVTALKENIIFGAAQDVHETNNKINEELKKLNNIILTPYIGSATLATKTAMAISCAESVVSVLQGGITPETAVNKPVFNL